MKVKDLKKGDMFTMNGTRSKYKIISDKFTHRGEEFVEVKYENIVGISYVGLNVKVQKC